MKKGHSFEDEQPCEGVMRIHHVLDTIFTMPLLVLDKLWLVTDAEIVPFLYWALCKGCWTQISHISWNSLPCVLLGTPADCTLPLHPSDLCSNTSS